MCNSFPAEQCMLHPANMPHPVSYQCSRCAYCGEEHCQTKLKKCAGCGWIWYCDQKKDWKKHAFQCASSRVLKSQRHCSVHPTNISRPIPLPASDQCRRCGHCEIDRCLKKLKKCAGCGCIWYCSRLCQKQDWKKHSLQCVTFRVKKWQCRLLLDGTRLPERLIHEVVDYAVEPPPM